MSVTKCTFTNNKANYGGAIYSYVEISNLMSLLITSCNFTNNKADYGGAISDEGHRNENKISIKKSIFTNNTATYQGGAIFTGFEGPYYDISDSIFINNSAASGGALLIINTSISNCSFINNKAEFYGGAIYSYGYSMHIISSNFTGNTALNGGAIILTNATDVTINDSILTNNTAEVGSAIYKGLNAYNPDLTVTNSNFTDNKGGPVLYLYGNETKITGCNIINNTQGILIPENSNANINYNRIFNNTNNTGYDLDDGGIGSDLDFNWWGENHPKVNGTLNNYFIMKVTNATSLNNSNGTVTFDYTFTLNTGETVDNSLLPFFVTNVYTNVTTGIIESFDARFDRTFDITVNESGNILYTFITDNEIQALEGTATIPEDPEDPADPNDPIDPVDPVEPIDPEDNTNESVNDLSTASSAMKETGMPLIAILIVLLSSLGLIYRKK